MKYLIVVESSALLRLRLARPDFFYVNKALASLLCLLPERSIQTNNINCLNNNTNSSQFYQMEKYFILSLGNLQRFILPLNAIKYLTYGYLSSISQLTKSDINTYSPVELYLQSCDSMRSSFFLFFHFQANAKVRSMKQMSQYICHICLMKHPDHLCV